MSVYIYEEVDKITLEWHSGGGLVIVTERDPGEAWRAHLEAVAAEHKSNAAYLDPDSITQSLPEPSRVIAAPLGEREQVFVFSDAGCC